MPAYTLIEMTTEDLRAVCASIRSIGAVGRAAPAAQLPSETPKTPFFNLVPQQPEQLLSTTTAQQ